MLAGLLLYWQPAVSVAAAYSDMSAAVIVAIMRTMLLRESMYSPLIFTLCPDASCLSWGFEKSESRSFSPDARPAPTARIIPKRRRDATGKRKNCGKLFQNGGHRETCANLYVTCGLSEGRQCRKLGKGCMCAQKDCINNL